MATAQANADNAAAPLDQLLLAACSGGIITSMLLGHPAACGGQDRIAGLGLLVTVLDQAKGGLPAALASKAMLDRAAASWARKGYLDGATLAELFAWLRPGDLIEEATDALVKTADEAASDVPVTGVLDEAPAQRIRSLNQQVLARASAAGAGAVDGYEKALQDMADFETKIAGGSQLDWLQAVARSQTKFVTDLVSMYADAIRSGLSG
jgi:hypothetical protein